MAVGYCILSRIRMFITIEDPKNDWQLELAGNTLTYTVWLRKRGADVCPCPYLGPEAFTWASMDVPGKKQAGWLDILKMHWVNYKILDATFGKLQANNSHRFPSCGIILPLLFWPICFCHFCSIPVVLTSFQHPHLQHSELCQKRSCCPSLVV